ncbi:MAG: hypothetical protein AB8C13_04260 [Phycisphaerales bacterium]
MGWLYPNIESLRLKRLDKAFTVLDRNMIASDEVLKELESMLFKVRAYKPRNQKQQLQKERIETRMYNRCQIILKHVSKTKGGQV